MSEEKYKFELGIVDVKLFKSTIKIIKDFVTEVNFFVDQDGLRCTMMDPANVAMVVFCWKKEAMVMLEVPEPTRFCVNLETLYGILKQASTKDALRLRLVNAENLELELRGLSNRVFGIKTLDCESDETKVPALSFKAGVTLNSDVFEEEIKSADSVCESVTFKAFRDGDQLVFRISGAGEVNTFSVEHKPSPLVNIHLDKDVSVGSKFSVEYLKKMIQTKKIADRVNVAFSQDYPLKLTYVVADTLKLEYILAPRVDND